MAGKGPSQGRRARRSTRLENASIKDIFGAGLHEFLTGFIDDNDALGAVIGTQYLIHSDEIAEQGQTQAQA